MNRRGFLATAAASVCTLSTFSQEYRQQPNILWIYCDDHSHAAISAYGGILADAAPTPHIDRIAKEGVLFQNSFVANSICAPSRAIILTGKHSHLNGVRKNGDHFDGSQQTFPKLLQHAGYETAVIGKWHLHTNPTGFDHWEILPGQGHYYNPDFQTEKGEHRELGYVTDLVTDKAIEWMDHQRDPDKPFMLMLQHKAPHREWSPALRHLTLFDDVEMPEPATLFDDYEGRGTAAKIQDMSIAKTLNSWDLKITDVKPIRDKEAWYYKAYTNCMGRMTEDQRRAWHAAYGPKNRAFIAKDLTGDDLIRWKYQRYIKDYLRCIRAVDESVGRVLEFLEKSGLANNTVVMYSSDQSFYLGEHGWFDKRFMYEESLRTPLLCRWPGIVKPNSEIDELVQNIDMAETFLDIAGAPIPEDMQGISLVPMMKGDTSPEPRESIYYQYYEDGIWAHSVQTHYGVRTDRYKLIFFDKLNEWEFYDLEKDPSELTSQYANPEYRGEIERLKQELIRLRRLYNVTDPS